jgi:GntR family transcriptional regulator/MocR family aminotransferase
VLEDDYDSEYRYDGRPIAAIQGLDRAGRVLYVGTFTKMLYPSLRLAYLIAPDGLVDAFVAARRLIDGHPPVLMQAVAADFMEGGHLVAHLRAMRALYGERRAVLVEALGRELGGAARLGPADAGLHVTLHLDGVSDLQVRARALALGVDASTLSGQAIRPGAANGLILGDAALAPAVIREGVRVLARALAGGRRPAEAAARVGGAGYRPRRPSPGG